MKYPLYLQQLLSQQTSFKSGELLNPHDTSHDPFIGVQVNLLPEVLHQKYFLPLSVIFPRSATFITIVRATQESEVKRKIDFYSTWKADLADTDTPAVIMDDFIKALTADKWILNLRDEENLEVIFTRNKLKLTVAIEVLPDVENYPFWAALHHFNIKYSKDHIPRLERYIHITVEVPE